jgi:aspartate aminotransferase
VEQYHIHLPKNGRINVSGLNANNLGWVARAIDEVVRGERAIKIVPSL